ncbi:MAG: TolC family outer membrane protein [Gammaproteobacteria bacterium]|jgi:outer membrane protein
MIKRIIISCLGIIAFLVIQQAGAANLWQVYQQALKSDPTYQAAIATQLSKAEEVPINLALLLPQLNLNGNAAVSKGSNASNTPTASYSKYNYNSRSYEYTLKLTQSVFNITYWGNLASAKNTVKAANATFNAAAQDLMQRTSSAYFAVLQSKEILRYTKANKEALYQQYMQAFQGYKVGVKTITDVYQARAQYESAISTYITAKNDLSDKFEDLRAITGILYKNLTPLKSNLPLVNPQPNDIDQWVRVAVKQNWSLIAARYTTLASHDTIMSERGGHFPTADLYAAYDKTYTNTFSHGTTSSVSGPEAGVEVTFPIFSGGGVSASVRQAIANYENSSQLQEQTYRNTVNQTRQSFLGVLTGISTIKANQRAVISSESSLKGTQEEYKVGTQTMVDVLVAQKKLYDSQKEYVNSRYDYVNSLISLKLYAGTLSANDLAEINGWLQYPYTQRSAVKKRSKKHRAVRTMSKPAHTQVNSVRNTQGAVVKKHRVVRVTSKPAHAKVKHTHKLSKNYEYVQVGAYSTLARATKVAHLVHDKTKLSFKISPVKHNTRTLYRVRIGPVYKKDVGKLVKQLHSL